MSVFCFLKIRKLLTTCTDHSRGSPGSGSGHTWCLSQRAPLERNNLGRGNAETVRMQATSLIYLKISQVNRRDGLAFVVRELCQSRKQLVLQSCISKAIKAVIYFPQIVGQNVAIDARFQYSEQAIKSTPCCPLSAKRTRGGSKTRQLRTAGPIIVLRVVTFSEGEYGQCDFLKRGLRCLLFDESQNYHRSSGLSL
jgi:hypothetical protein